MLNSLLDQVRNLQARAMGILEKAEASGDLRTALAAIGQAKGVLELQAKVSGEIGGPAEESQPDPLHVNLANIIALPKATSEEIERLMPTVVVEG